MRLNTIFRSLLDFADSLQNGPIESLKNEIKRIACYYRESAIFRIVAVSTISAGRSMLLNSLIGKQLLPSARTTITEIVDNKNYSSFFAKCFDKSGSLVKEYSNLTYDLMEKLNSDKSIDSIRIAGNVNSLDSDCVTLKIVDIPPATNIVDIPEHRDMIYQILNDSTRLGVILYVLDIDHLGITDDKALLENISKIMSESASKKSLRDKFLFVVNKMDKFDPEKQNIQEELGKVRNYLNRFGIDDPQIFPCSSLLAMCLRDEYSQKIDINRIFDLNRNEKSVLSKDGKNALTIVDLLYDCEQMHLERYASLPLGLKKKIEERLHKAIDDGNIKEQLLIHSGIPSLEEYISVYISKYAVSKNIDDFSGALSVIIKSEYDKILEQFACSKAELKLLHKGVEAAKSQVCGKEIKYEKFEKCVLAKHSKELEIQEIKENLLWLSGKLFELESIVADKPTIG